MGNEKRQLKNLGQKVSNPIIYGKNRKLSTTNKHDHLGYFTFKDNLNSKIVSYAKMSTNTKEYHTFHVLPLIRNSLNFPVVKKELNKVEENIEYNVVGQEKSML